ncbi:hypothetical protein [Kibdelosporangium phytohabitans]|uniref:NlpC/P60 domain-containing protein n=1 Tax=Kibdelosporangium phytohabitans TaxID=860235 RepID=A0A0N9HY62_9PSEU|nr:hypothetical protein [Kibdelosporangium phytohabitans]ALG08251.1 hypothetical protein AOZ06_16220 [Kibdelosporangium phytohabitans]MBE1470737.1 hypothetical protein [Kibdelosporangium phytohabitans]
MHLKSILRRGVVIAAAAALSGALFTGGAAASISPSADGDMGALFNCATYPSDQQVTRSQVLARAQTWIDARVPYSQAACHDNQQGSYRTDCSGYVSMAWGLRRSFTTSDIHLVSHTIARSDLRPGDALNNAGSHMALFVGWADAARTKPIVREQAGPPGDPTAERVWSSATAAGYTPIRYNNVVETNNAHPRFVFVNAAGDVFAKDDPYGAWVGFFSGGVTKVVASGDWTGVLAGGNFYAKQGLYGSWLTLAGGGDVRDIAVSGNRFAFVSGAGLFAKDGVYSSWVEQGSAGSRVVLDGDWIGFLGGGVFYAKKGLYGAWLTMSGGGGVTDIAIEGDRFAYATNGGVYAKDGAYSSWVTLGGGGTKVVLDGDWIGVLSGGNFHAKQGLYGSWLALAGGGGVTDITMSGGWFGMAAGGNFLAKQGEYSSWTTFAGGGQVIATAITSVG